MIPTEGNPQMKETTTEQGRSTGGGEWFAAWLPKPVSPKPVSPSHAESILVEAPEAAEPVEPTPPAPSPFEEARSELQAVTEHLIDPSAKGIRASIPHLERAVTAFGRYVKTKELPTVEPALDTLRAELALATTLFENAYSLQAGWASQLGLNLDGTPRQLLYSMPGAPVVSTGTSHAETWEG